MGESIPPANSSVSAANSSVGPISPQPAGDQPAHVGEAASRSGRSDPRREALITSLRDRFALAEARGDAEAKQALFREAVYLGLPPELWQHTPMASHNGP